MRFSGIAALENTACNYVRMIKPNLIFSHTTA